MKMDCHFPKVTDFDTYHKRVVTRFVRICNFTNVCKKLVGVEGGMSYYLCGCSGCFDTFIQNLR